MNSVQFWVAVSHVLGYLLFCWLVIVMCVGGAWRNEKTWQERFIAHFENLTWKFWVLMFLSCCMTSLKVTPPGA